MSTGTDDNLARRYWVMENMDFILDKMLYFRAKLDDWPLPARLFLDFDERYDDLEEGSIDL